MTLHFRYILCTSLHWVISEGRFAYHYVKRTTTRGKSSKTVRIINSLCHITRISVFTIWSHYESFSGVDQRLCDSFCWCCRLLSCVKRNSLSGQCWKRTSFYSSFGANHSQKYTWNQKFAWDSEWPRKHLWIHAGLLNIRYYHIFIYTNTKSVAPIIPNSTNFKRGL